MRLLELCLLKNTITIYRLKWELYNAQSPQSTILANIIHNQQILSLKDYIGGSKKSRLFSGTM